MAYSIYLDKKEDFKCKIYLEGASLLKAKARIIIESDGVNLLFNGTIDRNGNCNIPIRNVSGLLDEGQTGRMKLEVIAEDTYFQPWNSIFNVEMNKKLKVEIFSGTSNKKPKAVMKRLPQKNKGQIEVNSFIKILKEHGITKKNFKKNKKPIMSAMKQYVDTVQYKHGEKKFLREIVHKIWT